MLDSVIKQVGLSGWEEISPSLTLAEKNRSCASGDPLMTRYLLGTLCPFRFLGTPRRAGRLPLRVAANGRTTMATELHQPRRLTYLNSILSVIADRIPPGVIMDGFWMGCRRAIRL